MESVWKFKTDGKKQVYTINWHNKPLQVIFAEIPQQDVEITITTKE